MFAARWTGWPPGAAPAGRRDARWSLDPNGSNLNLNVASGGRPGRSFGAAADLVTAAPNKATERPKAVKDDSRHLRAPST